MGDFEPSSSWISKLHYPENVIFVPVVPSRMARFFNWFNRKKIFVYAFYLAYNLWQRDCYKKGKHICSQKKFDLIHFLGPIGYREPGYLWKLRLPYLWGPVGGMDNISPEFMRAMPWQGRIKSEFRNLLNLMQLNYSRRVRKVFQHADVVIASTTSIQKKIQDLYQCNCAYLPENGLVILPSNSLQKKLDLSLTPLKLIFIGRIEAMKMLSILLDSIRRLQDRTRIKLDIIGDGPLTRKLQKEYSDLAGNLIWHGALPRCQVLQLLKQSHLHCICSAKEANPTVIWEAMAEGVPTLSVDHCGMHDIVLPDCGIPIAVGSYEQMVAGFSRALEDCLAHPEKIEKLSSKVIETAKRFSWEERSVFFTAKYMETVEHYKNHNRLE